MFRWIFSLFYWLYEKLGHHEMSGEELDYYFSMKGTEDRQTGRNRRF